MEISIDIVDTIDSAIKKLPDGKIRSAKLPDTTVQYLDERDVKTVLEYASAEIVQIAASRTIVYLESIGVDLSKLYEQEKNKRSTD